MSSNIRLTAKGWIARTDSGDLIGPFPTKEYAADRLALAARLYATAVELRQLPRRRRRLRPCERRHLADSRRADRERHAELQALWDAAENTTPTTVERITAGDTSGKNQ